MSKNDSIWMISTHDKTTPGMMVALLNSGGILAIATLTSTLGGKRFEGTTERSELLKLSCSMQ